MRVGAAYGAVLRRLGDVFGEPVNIASRLTSIARPGRVLVDRELAEALRPHEEEFRLRRVRGISVKGYSRLETWALKRPRGLRGPRGGGRRGARGALGPAADPAPPGLHHPLNRRRREPPSGRPQG